MIPPAPINRTVTPVQSSWRLFRSETARRVALGLGAVAAIGVFGYTMYGAFTTQVIEHKPSDTGSSTITQSVPDLPAVTDTNKPPAHEEKPPPGPPPASEEKPPPKTVPAPVYVVFPTTSASAFFEVPPPPAKHDDKASAEAANAATADANATKVLFKPSTMSGGKAGKAMRTDYVMMPQVIPCALDTAMDSTLAGVIFCHTTQDVRSPARVLLMPAHTLVTGTYKNDIRNGQRRLFAFTGNAFTEEGIPVPLDSQVADGLGRAGVEGDVNNHYVEKFGAAIALTGFQEASNILQALVSKGGNGGNSIFNLNSGGGGGGGVENLATEILRQQSTIASTVSVPPGTIVSLIVDHPISFDGVIKVGARE